MANLVFDGQREGEEVKFIFRRHIFTAKKGLFFLILMTIIGFLLMIIWPKNSEMFWAFLGCVGVGVIGFVYAYVLWYFSLYIVTDQRIRQISQKGLFKKTVVDLGLDKIQSISYGVPGILAGILGYGTILIQTGVGDLVISQVSKPDKIYDKLQNVMKGK
ncbi:MAG: PH domain-containing protein [Candidatus Saccharibacteria bacterium]|nr:PH domain-containing protein [Candidatus Saccharibacteria bacterium]MDO4967662.1 PH domain-containing protein [Candidatus Saccharibacteria bacterium]